MEIVVTTTLALGSRELAQEGAIVTRLAAIEDLSGMNILCSDKTGTLTMNKMMSQEECPTFMAGFDQAKVRQRFCCELIHREVTGTVVIICI